MPPKKGVSSAICLLAWHEMNSADTAYCAARFVETGMARRAPVPMAASASEHAHHCVCLEACFVLMHNWARHGRCRQSSLVVDT